MASVGTVAAVAVEVSADTSKLKSGLADAGEQANKSSGIFGALGGSLGKLALVGGGVVGGFLAIKDVVGDVISKASDAEQVQAQLTNTIANFGGKTGITANQVNALADKLSLIAPYDDEAITSVDTLLTRVDGMSSKALPGATQAVLDFAAGMNVDLNTAAKQVAKELENPDKAMGMLARQGIHLDAATQATIKSMVKQGDVAGAQAIILGKLEDKYKGSAAAAGNNFAGAQERLNTQLDNIKENIGMAVLPVLTQMLNAIIPIVHEIANNFAPVLGQLAAVFAGKVLPIVQQLAGYFMKNVLPVLEKLAVYIIGNVLPVIIKFDEYIFKNILPVLEKLWNTFSTKILPILMQLAQKIMQEVMPQLEHIFSAVMDKLVPAVMKLWDKISPVLIPALQFLANVLGAVLGPALSVVGDILSTVIDIISTLLDWVGKAIDGFGRMANAVGGAFKGVTNFLSKIPGVGNLLPHFAGGTTYAPGGMALVGEQGPELVYLPRGSQVMTASQTRNMATSGGGLQSGPVYLVLDGQVIGQALMPHIYNAAMGAVGVH